MTHDFKAFAGAANDGDLQSSSMGPQAAADPDLASSGQFAALDRVSGELRAAQAPELDWSRVEQRLLERVEADERARRALVATRVRSGLPRAFGFAAAAAALMLGFANLGGPHHEATARAATHDVAVADLAAPDATGARELSSLRVGDVVTAGAEPLRFEQAGIVAWTLAPGARATVRSMGVAGLGQVIALDRGSVRAEVVPRSASEGMIEAFAVEVEGTRVAVHGTAFTVTREPTGLVVDVEHGAVAIGPAGHMGETSGHLLVGPSRARFSLDGGRTASFLPRDASPVAAASLAPSAQPAPTAAANTGVAQAPVADPASVDDRAATPGDAPLAVAAAGAHAHPVVAPSEPIARSAEPPPAPSAEPTPAVVTYSTQASVESKLHSCFKELYGNAGPGAASMTMSSTMKVTINPDGSVMSARIDPFVASEFTACAGPIASFKFAPGTANLSLTFTFSR
jgi:hypothetical protein